MSFCSTNKRNKSNQLKSSNRCNSIIENISQIKDQQVAYDIFQNKTPEKKNPTKDSKYLGFSNSNNNNDILYTKDLKGKKNKNNSLEKKM